MLTAAVVVPVVTLLALLALLLLLLGKGLWTHNVGGKVQPPELGPDTTFLITDIQVGCSRAGALHPITYL